MKPFYRSAFRFWFVLLIVALINATIRETTYKPFLTPYIGIWAHQLSSLTGILLFFGATILFLKRCKDTYTQGDLIKIGILWVLMTLMFETGMNMFIRKLTIVDVIRTYYFWNGDTWIFVLLFLGVSPLLSHKILNRRT